MTSRPLAPGTRLGAYTIRGLLGRGGMGAVYEAQDARGEVVALKVMLAAQEDRHRVRFRREAKAAQAVSHPNVVAIRDVGDEQGVLFLALELMPGGTVQKRIREKGRLPWSEAARLGAAIARGLAALHAAGLVHRDLKPDNVLLDSSGRAKVSDLGLVGKGTALGFSIGSLTKTGELLGTLEYMAPEQAEHAGRVDARADLYSLGATLFAMLTGEPPFSGTGVELIAKHLRQPPRAPSELAPEVPRPLDALVLSLLEKRPDARPGSATEVARSLDEIVRTGGARGARRSLLVPAALAVALAAGGGVALAFWSGRREPEEKNPGEAARNAPKPTPTTTRPAPPVPRPGALFPDVASGFRRSAKGAFALSRIFGSYGGKLRKPVTAIAFSPDGKAVLTGSQEPALVLWDLERGSELRRFQSERPANPRDGWPIDVAFSRDGALAISCGEDGTLRTFDARTGEPRSARREERRPRAIAVAPRGSRLFTANADGTVSVLDLSTVAELNHVKAHEGAASSIAFDATGTKLLSGGADRTVRLWDTDTFGALRTLAHAEPVASVALSPDGARALGSGGEAEKTAILWDTASGAEIATFRSPSAHAGEHTAREVAISPDGKRALLASATALRVLDLEGGAREAAALPVTSHWSTDVLAVAFSPDGKRAATGECCRQARLWDLAAEREIGAEARGAPTESTTIALTRDGRRALVPCGDGLLRIWELASGKMLAPFERSPADLNTLALSPDEKRVVTAHHRRTVQAWDVATGARIWARTDAHANNVLAVAVSPDGRRALSGADESTLKLWDMDSGKEAGRFEALPGVWVLSVAFSPDGKQVLVAGVAGERREQGSLELFSLDGDTATQTKRLSGHQAGVHGVAFLPDGKRALTASADATLKLWDLATGAVLRSFAHEARVLRALPVAGERAVSTSDDGTIRLWDLSSGAEVDRIDLASSHDAPYGLAVSRDGRSIFAATHLGVLLRFDERERR